MDIKRVLRYLKENPVFYLATVDGDQARVRPFGAVAEFEGKLYIVTSSDKAVCGQMMENGKVEICTMDRRGGWLRVTGRAVRDDRYEAKEQMLAENGFLRGLYDPRETLEAVFALEEASAVYYQDAMHPVGTPW